MKEDLELLSVSMTRVLMSVGAIRSVGARFEHLELGRKAEGLADDLKKSADAIADLIALRLREGGDYE